MIQMMEVAQGIKGYGKGKKRQSKRIKTDKKLVFTFL
jgi:hypothetical protein